MDIDWVRLVTVVVGEGKRRVFIGEQLLTEVPIVAGVSGGSFALGRVIARDYLHLSFDTPEEAFDAMHNAGIELRSLARWGSTSPHSINIIYQYALIRTKSVLVVEGVPIRVGSQPKGSAQNGDLPRASSQPD